MTLLGIQRNKKNENYLNYWTENQIYEFGHREFHMKYKDGEKTKKTYF